MIRHRSPPRSLAPVVACLALAFAPGARLTAAEGHAEIHPAAAAPAPEAPARTDTEPAKSEPPAPLAVAKSELPKSSADPVAPAPAATAPTPAATKPTARQRATDEIHGLLNLGASLTERADYDAAEIAYRQVLNTPHVAAPELTTALLGLAHMHRRQGALTKAVAIYERFLKDYPADEHVPDALLNVGRTYRSLGVYKRAIASFYSVINSTLKLPSGQGFERYQLLAKTAQFEIAETHFQAGEFADAGKLFGRLRLLELAPSDRARAHFMSGYSRRLEGDLEGAISTFRAYLEQWPADENVPEARYLLAVTLRELKRPQEAFQATLDLLHEEKSRVASDPKRWAYWQRRTGNQLANDFFETGDTLNAHAIYAGLVELSPEPAWRLPIVYQIALCYERLGVLDRARTAFQSIVDTVGKTPNPDLAELARMAAWRIDHLEWRDQVAGQITKFFETTTGRPVAATPAPAPLKTASTP